MSGGDSVSGGCDSVSGGGDSGGGGEYYRDNACYEDNGLTTYQQFTTESQYDQIYHTNNGMTNSKCPGQGLYAHSEQIDSNQYGYNQTHHAISHTSHQEYNEQILPNQSYSSFAQCMTSEEQYSMSQEQCFQHNRHSNHTTSPPPTQSWNGYIEPTQPSSHNDTPSKQTIRPTPPEVEGTPGTASQKQSVENNALSTISAISTISTISTISDEFWDLKISVHTDDALS